jgi:hypothetical protein
MQVLIILLLWFSDSLVFGLRPLWGYPVAVPVIWCVCSALFMFIPWLRVPCVDESSESNSETMHSAI